MEKKSRENGGNGETGENSRDLEKIIVTIPQMASESMK
jgi:hypothetical protein